MTHHGDVTEVMVTSSVSWWGIICSFRLKLSNLRNSELWLDQIRDKASLYRQARRLDLIGCLPSRVAADERGTTRLSCDLWPLWEWMCFTRGQRSHWLFVFLITYSRDSHTEVWGPSRGPSRGPWGNFQASAGDWRTQHWCEGSWWMSRFFIFI